MNSTQSTEKSSTTILLEDLSKYLTPDTNGFPRQIAGELLQRVGMCGDYGGVARGISPFLIGIAIQRLVSNYTEGDEWKIEFLKGLFFHPRTTIHATIEVHVTPEDRSLAENLD
jgi:hypothetical protein